MLSPGKGGSYLLGAPNRLSGSCWNHRQRCRAAGRERGHPVLNTERPGSRTANRQLQMVIVAIQSVMTALIVQRQWQSGWAARCRCCLCTAQAGQQPYGHRE